MPPQTPTDKTLSERRPGSQVGRLIDRLKNLVAEQRRLDEDDSEDRRRDANRRDIARLKWRQGAKAWRKLNPGTGLRFLQAFAP